MSEKKFIDGLIVKPPRDGAPDYVVGKLSMKREQLIAWLQQQSGEWVNADIKIANSGSWYAQVDDWKPNRQGGGNAPQRQQTGGYGQQRPQQQAPQQAPIDDFADDDLNF
ncbi:hypothetical protein [Stenotrophomonas tumulicola]|uniref:Uncharacterized protein n=1 Tax=Stenotrophomonas tumulicola TaxID=1685415 RepID=A0A7W3IHD4_9GAMM|nr:hypothetical protein [Stenotrophomonas tumulicola]MBA8680479.1 hypothetical protein [Stenotrophomonas tumulicola]